jgi:hypothetical protein
MKLNGIVKTAGIAITIVLAIGSIIWAVAIRSGNLDGLIEDIAKHEVKYDKVEERVDTVEKVVIRIETNMKHFQKGQDDMVLMQREILNELRK